MIPFLDTKISFASIRDEAIQAVTKVLESGRYALGSEVEHFETEFAKYCNTTHTVAVNSGTSALHLALMACGVGAGDQVITTPMTFVATVAAIQLTGAQPVLVDISQDSYTLDPDKIKQAITPKTKAIIPVHLYGQTADMGPIMTIAQEHGLVVIEDACQAHGAKYKDRRAGSLGHMACFSFYPGKNLGACGEGGAVTTSDANYAKKLRMLRDWGQERKYEHVLKGLNYRMDNIQGAVLRIKLRNLDSWTDSRINLAKIYTELLTGSAVKPPQICEWSTRHVYHIYPILVENREAFIAHLTENEIQSGIHYPYPVHLLPAYSDLGYKKGDFPNSEYVANRELSLPMYPELSEKNVKIVAKTLLDF